MHCQTLKYTWKVEGYENLWVELVQLGYNTHKKTVLSQGDRSRPQTKVLKWQRISVDILVSKVNQFRVNLWMFPLDQTVDLEAQNSYKPSANYPCNVAV